MIGRLQRLADAVSQVDGDDRADRFLTEDAVDRAFYEAAMDVLQ
ncbi:hypothetical protein ACIRRA_40735 [Nocardia sp. NPDC101769]